MKRLVGAFALASLLTAICASHSAYSLPPPGLKQKICHIDPSSPVTSTGVVIEIAKKSIPAHCRNHRDYTGAAVDGLAVGAQCPARGATFTCAVQ